MSDNSETEMDKLLERIKIRDQNMEQLLQKFRYQNTKRIICNNEYIKKIQYPIIILIQ